MKQKILYKGEWKLMSQNAFEKAVIRAKNKWQDEVMIKIFSNHITLIHKGVIIAATGSGKTYLQAKMIVRLAKILNGFGVVVVKSPRIQLTQQLTEEIQKIAGDKIDSIMFHSGKGIELVEDHDQEDKDEVRNAVANAKLIGATTSLDDVKNKIEECRRNNKLLVIQSTYHSFDKLCSLFKKEKITIEMILNDECQYVETFGHSNCIANREYFFTATATKGNIGGKQMFLGEDEEEKLNPKFGTIIYKLTPAKAIKEGIITPATWISLNMEGVTEEEAKTLSHKTIKKSFDKLKEVKKGKTTNMLVTESRVSQIKALTKPQSDLMKACSDTFKVLTIASTYGTITDNGKIITREEFSERLKKYSTDDNVDLIVVHYDILSEGIDVPSMHGVLFLRSVSIAKFYQILGRCLRTSYGKDYGYMIAPSYSNEGSMFQSYRTYINNMFEEGYLPKDIKSPKEEGSSGEFDPKEAQLTHLEAQIQFDIEDSQSIEEKLKRLIKKYGGTEKLV